MKLKPFKVLIVSLFLLYPTYNYCDTTKTQLNAYTIYGDEVENFYKVYTDRLVKLFDELHLNVKKFAPQLNERLRKAPPAPVTIGYQILPKIIFNKELQDTSDKKPESVSYSWKKTKIFITVEANKIEDISKKMQKISGYGPNERESILSTMLDEYRLLESNQILIDHHIQYNRFWQDAVFKDKKRFNELTKLHDAVLERTAIQSKINSNQSNAVLLSRLSELDSIIQKETFGKIDIPPFAKILRPNGTSKNWIIHIPLYTDIKDTEFINKFKATVERIWTYKEPTSKEIKSPPGFKVEVDIKYFSLGKNEPPTKSKVDLEKHISYFPKDRGVITTGAKSTFAIMNRYIALGPQDITDRVLAHEFGHILGFTDTYFRGYRDRGNEGYEILEIVPDYTDIMGNPDSGSVKLIHFERLMEKFITE